MDLTHYHEVKPLRLKRLVWIVVNNTLFRILICGKLKYLRNLLLRAFGAHLPLHVMVYPSAKVFAPWNLVMGRYSCIGPKVEIYNKATVELGDNCVISQGAKLYTAFIGMGVTIGEGAVVGARAAVFKDVEPWTVVGGNPAKFIKKRVIKDA